MSIEKAFLAKCDRWLESIKGYLETVSIKRARLNIQGNGDALIKKLGGNALNCTYGKK
jgi:hypothetical protein